MDGGKRGNILSRINARPRLEDCNVIIHLDDGTPGVYTRREVKAGTELAMFYGVDYVPFVNRPFESEIHGTVNFTQFCCVLLVTWCHLVLLSCYLRPKQDATNRCNLEV